MAPQQQQSPDEDIQDLLRKCLNAKPRSIFTGGMNDAAGTLSCSHILASKNTKEGMMGIKEGMENASKNTKEGMMGIKEGMENASKNAKEGIENASKNAKDGMENASKNVMVGAMLTALICVSPQLLPFMKRRD